MPRIMGLSLTAPGRSRARSISMCRSRNFIRVCRVPDGREGKCNEAEVACPLIRLSFCKKSRDTLARPRADARRDAETGQTRRGHSTRGLVAPRVLVSGHMERRAAGRGSIHTPPHWTARAETARDASAARTRARERLSLSLSVSRSRAPRTLVLCQKFRNCFVVVRGSGGRGHAHALPLGTPHITQEV